jgi:hypothetical protein
MRPQSKAHRFRGAFTLHLFCLNSHQSVGMTTLEGVAGW